MTLPFDATLLLLGAPLIVLAIFLSARGGKKSASLSYPYAATPNLFTPDEQHFLRVLEEAAGTYRVFGKVRLADVLVVRKGLSKSEQQRAFNRVSQKHLDFVLCHPDDLTVFCVVELDDKTHGRSDRRERDAFLERALEAAQVPLIRVPSRRSYNVEALRALLSPRADKQAA